MPKIALGICVAVLLAGSATPPVFADDTAGNNLPTIQIFKKVKDNYASMTTYSDEGCVVTASGTIYQFLDPAGADEFLPDRMARAGECPLERMKPQPAGNPIKV